MSRPVKYFLIRISSDHPNATDIVRRATERIATQAGWGDQNNATILATETHKEVLAGDETWISAWYMEPGVE